MFSSLSRWFRSRRGTVVNRASGRKKSTCKLLVETLEDRTVPSVSFGSALGVGNDNSSQAHAVAVDAAGNSYTAGFFTGTVDFDPGHTHAGDTDILTARGYYDIFVAKYTPDNTLVWAQRMGGDDISNPAKAVGAGDTAEKITIDASGNVYVTGWFNGTADFGSVNLTSAGGEDGFVTKLNSSGTVQWAKRWGTAQDDMGMGVAVDATGNVYALGLRLGAGYDILKFSPTGAAAWADYADTQTSASSCDLAVNAAGNVYVAGSFKGTVDFDPGSKTHNVSSGTSGDGFILNLTTTGAFGWVSPFLGKTVGSTTGWSRAYSLALDGSGNIIVGGAYNGTVDFDPGNKVFNLPSSFGGFITKLNSSGALVWAKALASNDTLSVYGLAVDAAGNIYASGALYGTVDFDPGAGTQMRTTAGGTDAFVLKLTSAGNFSWVNTFGSTGNDIAWGVAVDSAGSVYVAGSYTGTVDFDPDPFAVYELTTPAKTNAFLLKLNQH